MIRRLLYAWRKHRFCKANGYYCPDCIYHKFVWDEDFPVFRGVFCKYPLFKKRRVTTWRSGADNPKIAELIVQYREEHKTNYDRVRAMSIEEIASWRASGQCPPLHYHSDYDCFNQTCENCWLKWLQESCDDNSKEESNNA